MPNALILINSETGFEQEVLDYVAKIPGLEFAKRVYGTYNLVVKIAATTDDELKKTILGIRTHRLVKSTSTLLIREYR